MEGIRTHKVKDLIEMLSKLDQEKVIEIEDTEGNFYIISIEEYQTYDHGIEDLVDSYLAKLG